MSPPVPKSVALRIAILVAVVAAAGVIAHSRGWLNYENAATLVRELRAGRGRGTAAMIYLLSFSAAVAIGIPATIGILVGGALFGVVLGTALSWAGAMAGAIGGYWLARLVGHDSFRDFFCSHRSLERLANPDFWTLLRLRLVPVIPFSVLSFAAGITRAKQRVFLAATALGVFPSVAIYTYFADALLSGFGDARREAFIRLAVASVALLALSFFARRMRGGREQGAVNRS